MGLEGEFEGGCRRGRGRKSRCDLIQFDPRLSFNEANYVFFRAVDFPWAIAGIRCLAFFVCNIIKFFQRIIRNSGI